MREKESEGEIDRERGGERFFPTAGKTNSPPARYRGGKRRWRRRGRDARRAAGATKRGGEEGNPGWSRWWLGAAASKIHRNHTARLHRRSRHLPPPNRNETARVKHPILPPRRSCPATPAKQRPGEESPSPRRRRQPLSLDEGDVPTGSRDPRAEKFCRIAIDVRAPRDATTEDRDRRFDRRELKSLLPCVLRFFSFYWIFFRHR